MSHHPHNQHNFEQTFPDPLQATITNYYQHGNIRPSADRLTTSIGQLGDRNGPAHSLVVADMLVDLAMADQEQADKYLVAADGHLTSIIKRSHSLHDNGRAQGSKRMARFAVSARLKQGELANWSLVATGQPPRNALEPVLATAIEAGDMAKRTDRLIHTRARLIEYMPVLLGARADARQPGNGWLGRLSLSREDRKPLIGTVSNPNWDVGISRLDTEPTAADFDHPAIKVQVKWNHAQHAQRYANAHVLMVKAKTYGFSDPQLVTQSCLHEIDPETVDSSQPLLESSQLDEITARLRTIFQS